MTCERPELVDSPLPVYGSTEPPPDDATVAPEPTVAESAGWVWIGPIEGRAAGGRSAMQVAMDTLTGGSEDGGGAVCVCVGSLCEEMSPMSGKIRYSTINMR